VSPADRASVRAFGGALADEDVGVALDATTG
jgi:hypothetical protein